ncbi:MAG: DoxX family protein [Alphaproteobacteria bacterium]
MSVVASRSHAGGSLAASVHSILDTLERVPMPLMVLLMRLGIAAVFFKSGLTKIASWQATVQLFAMEYQVPALPPELAAYLAATFELTCPVLIVLGLATRLGALALLGMTAVIQIFVYPENWSEHLLWASILVYLAARGAGALSLDRVIARSWHP